MIASSAPAPTVPVQLSAAVPIRGADGRELPYYTDSTGARWYLVTLAAPAVPFVSAYIWPGICRHCGEKQ